MSNPDPSGAGETRGFEDLQSPRPSMPPRAQNARSIDAALAPEVGNSNPTMRAASGDTDMKGSGF